MTTGIQQDFGLRVVLKAPYAEAVERVTAALKEEGFGILTEIDVQATLKKKLGADFRKYVILGACNPPLANRALNAELEIGLLLPCNAIVYETDDGNSMVSLVNPMAMMEIADATELQAVAEEAEARLRRVRDCLAQGGG